MKIVFMGTPKFAVPSLEALIKSGHEVGLVVTQPDKRKNRGKKLVFSPVKELALKHEIPVYQPEKLRNDEETIAAMKAFKPDLTVVAAYGQILSKEVLEIAEHGSINVHGSLLPKLRGASPIQMSIYQGFEETGVTIMQMEEGLDTGDMLSKVSVKIDGKTYKELEEVLSQAGSELLIETIASIREGSANFEKQDNEESTYAHIIRKEDGKIDFSRSASEIECQIRAFDPWPGTFANIGGETIKFWKGAVLSIEEAKTCGRFSKTNFNGIKIPGAIVGIGKNSIGIATGDGILEIIEIQPAAKKRMAVSAYLLGHSFELLERFE